MSAFDNLITRRSIPLLITAVVVVSQCFPANAKRKGGPPSTQPEYTLIELPFEVDAMSPLGPNGEAWVVGGVAGQSYAIVDSTGIVESGQLPDPGIVAGVSGPNAVNRHGLMAGAVAVSDPNDIGGYLFQAAVCWPREDGSFGWETLDTLPATLGDNSFAYDVNDLGLVVGSCGGRRWACLWDPLIGVIDLNTLLPENSGWELFEAWRINDAGEIAGTGLLNGQVRAYVLNLAAETIKEIPLLPGFPENYASGLSANGHCVGVAFGTDVNAGYLWSGSVSDNAVELPPADSTTLDLPRGTEVTGSYADPSAVAAASVVVGTTQFQTYLSRTGENTRSKATIWKDNGATAELLETLIPSGSEWDLRYALGANDSGWVACYGVRSGKGKSSTTVGVGLVLVPIAQ